MNPAETYLSCAFIEKSLTLSPNALYHCCVSLHSTAGWARICDFAGGPLPVETIVRSRAELRENLQQGTCGYCDGCSAFLQEREWNNDGYLFNSLVLNHYTVCNLRCSYCCWLTSHPLPFGLAPYPALPILKEIVSNNWLSPGGLIAWGGGEPALCSDFPESLAFMIERGFAHEIYSNATRFSELIHEHIGNGLLKLMVSVDAGRNETYLKMKKADALDAVWENLEKYARRGAFNLTVKYILTAENCSEQEWIPFVDRVAGLAAGCCVAIDMSHGSPSVSSEIIDSMVAMEAACIRKGMRVLTGVHGAHSLPRERIGERLAASRSALMEGNRDE